MMPQVTVANISFHATAISAGGLVSNIEFKGLDFEYAAFSRRSLGDTSPPVAVSIWSNDIDDVGVQYGNHVVDDVSIRYVIFEPLKKKQLWMHSVCVHVFLCSFFVYSSVPRFRNVHLLVSSNASTLHVLKGTVMDLHC